MIHPDLPGVVVTLDVASQDLPEYDEDDIDNIPSRTCVKYVEAISGAEFGIAIRFDGEQLTHINDRLLLRVQFDGRSAGGRSFDTRQMRQPTRFTKQGVVSNTGDGRVVQAMMFSELTINEGIPDAGLFGKLGDLGTIRVNVFETVIEQLPPPKKAKKSSRSVKKAKEDATTDLKTILPLIPNGLVSEKTLKGQALTHQAALGPPKLLEGIGRSIAQPTTREVRKGPPLATYLFKYRSLAALQALHIMPRTPSPVPLEERPVEELSIDEMRELVTRQRAKEASQADRRVKQEFKRERRVDDGDVEVVGPVSKKARMSNAIGVVDLSFDD
ncbi:hypothetical protein LTR56_013770 [Elasticomyces elasticus]|nr:hypothetical protein LTR56_013770 [Elasticomyces elasticus]KAK4907094.1 hypothetical protein LTR49_023837 [Elasticomyces elasticus]KAK5755274.1 hypothetical protein LTS12_014613 [Elasticomyces elasticus]